ncbi:hypothetical protein D6833_08260 [Candidatus Parcubacteria bacterium]|nr:MAG: hypothetical protein D6833_08260 [Candidatus Parcubacteria bacterium]
MAKKTIKRDYRIVVWPRSPGDFGGIYIGGIEWKPGEEERLANQIAQEIQRHVDEIGAVRVEYDVVEVCEFCGYDWEEDEDGCPVCCTAALKEWERQQE